VYNGDLGYIVGVEFKPREVLVLPPPRNRAGFAFEIVSLPRPPRGMQRLVHVDFPPRPGKAEMHHVTYADADIDELQLAWAVTVHKAQGARRRAGRCGCCCCRCARAPRRRSVRFCCPARSARQPLLQDLLNARIHRCC
jgi:hypothetical protein